MAVENKYDASKWYPTTVGRAENMFQHPHLTHFLRVPGPTGFGSYSTASQVAAGWDGKGNVALITGATSGVGLESARVLASRGCEVYMAVRDVAKAEQAIQKMKAAVPESKFQVIQLELDSLASVKKCAETFLASGKPLHILLNNAGVMACPFKLSKDGHELQFATNHLGHFYLTQLLLDKIVATAKAEGTEGRIVTVSSTAIFLSYPEHVRLEDIDSPTGYHPWRAYGQSKLCNALFARELQERLKGQPVKAVSLHPGAIPTELQRHMPKALDLMFGLLMRPFLKSIPQGAATQVYCATAPHIVGGEYYLDSNPCPTPSYALDRPLGQKLWALSEKLVKDFESSK